jgi:two-component system response regulator BaeR
MSGGRVFVVEDEPKLAALARDYLQQAGHRVEIRMDGAGAAEWILEERPDIVVLDLMLPGEDGLSICRTLRQSSEVPVIMVTARVAEVDRLLGLEIGADDYLCKPFSPRELVLRVGAILRRSLVRIADDGVLRYANLTLDRERHLCCLGDATPDLTPVEFRLLAALLAQPGRVLSRDRLMGVAYNDHRVVSERTIDSHMRNLRQKLDAAASHADGTAPAIHSVYGVGYSCS